MRCKHCGKMNEPYELLGIKGIVCCGEYQVVIWSLRPRVREFYVLNERCGVSNKKKDVARFNPYSCAN